MCITENRLAKQKIKVVAAAAALAVALFCVG